MTAEAEPINDLPFFLQFRIAGDIGEAKKNLADAVDISFFHTVDRPVSPLSTRMEMMDSPQP